MDTEMIEVLIARGLHAIYGTADVYTVSNENFTEGVLFSYDAVQYKYTIKHIVYLPDGRTAALLNYVERYRSDALEKLDRCMLSFRTSQEHAAKCISSTDDILSLANTTEKVLKGAIDRWSMLSYDSEEMCMVRDYMLQRLTDCLKGNDEVISYIYKKSLYK